MLDIGGRRSARRQWMRHFDEIQGVIFIAALSDYDLTLYEDHSINRMSESLRLFACISNNRWFKTASMILFLNKTDIFEAKITGPDGAPLTVCFPQYAGNLKSVPETSAFVRGQFAHRCRNLHKELYSHFTCAIETNNIQFIFSAVSDMLIQQTATNVVLY